MSSSASSAAENHGGHLARPRGAGQHLHRQWQRCAGLKLLHAGAARCISRSSGRALPHLGNLFHSGRGSVCAAPGPTEPDYSVLCFWIIHHYCRGRAGEKPEPVRTHLRNMLIMPEMIGSVVGVYNGKTFNQVHFAVVSTYAVRLELWSCEACSTYTGSLYFAAARFSPKYTALLFAHDRNAAANRRRFHARADQAMLPPDFCFLVMSSTVYSRSVCQGPSICRYARACGYRRQFARSLDFDCGLRNVQMSS